MSQEDYDQGYADGRASMQGLIDCERQWAEWARADLEHERTEISRLRRLLHPARIGADCDVPF